jgi:signal-transduction protein with cAMP-binding, CBS, and nucleotidyltransferase domain
MRLMDRPEWPSKGRPLAFKADATVREAAGAMAARGYGACLVEDAEGRVIGIFTERDLLRRVVGDGRDPTTTLLGDVMTREIRTARPDDLVLDWLRQMSNERFRHLPVLDETGRAMKMISQGDLVSYTWPDLLRVVGMGGADSLLRQYPFLPVLGGIMLYTLLLVAMLQLV